MNKSFYTRNRNKLYETLPDGALLVLFSGGEKHRSADEDVRFFANRNFVYMTGVTEPDCILLARRVRGVIHETLFIRDPDPEAEKWTGRRITVKEATEHSGIKDVELRSMFDAAFHKMANDTYFIEIYLCLEGNRGQDKTDQNNLFRHEVLDKYPNLAIYNAFPQIALQRMIKSAEELAAIDKAIKVTRKGIMRMLAVCRYAKTEMDLFAEFMYVIHKHGYVEPAYKPIVSCGANNFYLHYNTPAGKLVDGALCLADVGARVNHCCADISRVFPCNGTFSEKQKQLYDIALEINDTVTKTIKPGMFFSDINKMNEDLSFPRLKALGILSRKADLSNYVWHRCSHHIGFDVHDVGSYETPLAEGMFFSMDMGLYVRDWNIGMRIEDNVVVTADGLKNLSGSIPRTTEEIEAVML